MRRGGRFLGTHTPLGNRRGSPGSFFSSLGFVLLLAGAPGGCSAPRRASDGRSEGGAGLRAQARARLDAGDASGALELLERCASIGPEDGETSFLLGLATEAAAGETPRAALLYGDAVAHFERAGRLRPGDPLPRLGLARVALREGDFERAAEEAGKAEELADGPDRRYEAARLRASALGGSLRSGREGTGSRDDSSAARVAVEAARALLSLDPQREEGYLLLAEIESTLGREDRERAVLLEGARAIPGAISLHARAVEAHATTEARAALLAFYESLGSERPQDAVVAWFLGRSAESTGDSARGENRFEEADRLYAKAAEAYGKSASLRADFRETAAERSWWTVVSRGWCAYGLGRLREAAERFAEAIARAPDLRGTRDAFGRTAKDGVDFAALALMEAGDLETGEALLARASASAPTELDWWTNLGYYRWELGQRRQADGRRRDAAETFEAALASYERAREIAPDDPSALNDCVLILYYHLKREDERVERYLRHAIESGERLLQDAGLDEKRRRLWDEGTGNAYQNLGVLLYEKKHDLAAARRCLETSLQHYPHSRAQARRYLARIEREQGLVSPAASGPSR